MPLQSNREGFLSNLLRRSNDLPKGRPKGRRSRLRLRGTSNYANRE